MNDFRFRFNPRFGDMSQCSTLLNGIARRYRAEQYRTTLCVKTVSAGAALYVTRYGRHLVTEDSFLILNHGQEYSLEFQGLGITETLCPFFQPGFVEQVAGAHATPAARQLDEIATPAPVTDFPERLYPKTGPLGTLLRGLHRELATPAVCTAWLEDRFYGLATVLVELRNHARDEMAEFPGRRPATRAELYRRLYRGRDFLSACHAEAVTVALAAKAAHLSPYHFHRMFKRAFGQSPMQFLQEYRLSAARRLLATTDQPITAISLAVGFESLGSFSWLFRKRFGLAPRLFRAEQVSAIEQD
jgi:AraC family transcriptional regulator